MYRLISHLENLDENRYFNRIIKENDLISTYIYASKNNKSRKLPYHGIHHAIKLVLSIQYFIHTKLFEDTLNTNFKSVHDKNLLKNLITAALFHDFNYVGWSDDPNYDDINIKEAVDALIHFRGSLSGTTPYSISVSQYYEKETKLICDYIKSTRWPHKEKSIYVNNINIQHLLCDADFSMPFYNDFYKMSFGYAVIERGITDKDLIISNCIDFLENLKFYNSKIQDTWNKIKKKKIEELITYSKNGYLDQLITLK